MEIEVVPEPDEEERAAIERALDRRRAEDAEAAGGSRWWRAGVEESTREDFARD